MVMVMVIAVFELTELVALVVLNWAVLVPVAFLDDVSDEALDVELL
jgi:hypothetical protein